VYFGFVPSWKEENNNPQRRKRKIFTYKKIILSASRRRTHRQTNKNIYQNRISYFCNFCPSSFDFYFDEASGNNT